MGKVIKNAAIISGLTFGSRVLGVIRDALIAVFFGTGYQSDVFFIAFRPFDLVRKLFSEGILSISFIPVFTKTLTKEGKDSAISMVFSFFCFLSFLCVLIVVAGFIFAPLIIKYIGSGFVAYPDKFDLAVLLFRIMLPYLWFIIIVALCMGVLNSYGNFGAPAVAPVVFNLVIITFTVFITAKFDIPAIGLALGVSIGGAVQLAVQVPFMNRIGILRFKKLQLFNPNVVRVIRIMIPCMIGAASYQINIMIASFFASKLDVGNVSFLYFADRLVQFPLALFAVSAATVFLPELSKKSSFDQVEELGKSFANTVKMVFFITIPAMAGLMALNYEIISLLFGHGKFDAVSILKTGECLFVLVTGLWAFTGVRLFVTLYYALFMIRIPFYCGLFSIGVNASACFFIINYFELKGLVLSVSIASAINFILLFINLPDRVKIDKKDIVLSACRALFFSAIMFFLVKGVAGFFCSKEYGSTVSILGISGTILSGIIFYCGVNFILSTPEFKIFKKGIIDKWQ